MRLLIAGSLVSFIACISSDASAQTLSPINSFGVSAPGWLAPGNTINAFTYNDNSVLATVRGIAYHSASNRLIVVDRLGGLVVRVLNGNTGEQVHTLNSQDIVTGVAPGTFVGNMVDVDDDGNVYMNNLLASTQPFYAVYRWSSSSVQNLTNDLYTTAYLGAHNRNRIGDSFAVIGSGANTRIVSAGGNTAGDSAFVLLTTANGMNFSLSNPAVAGNDNGAFRLGIDFAGTGSVVGNQTSPYITIAPEAGGAAQTSVLTTDNQSIVAYHAPTKLLATIAFTSSNVRLYDATDLSNLQFLDMKNITTSFVGNANGVGALSFGYGPDSKLRLYALNANNGIQAFEVNMPAPNASILSRSVVHGGWLGGGSPVDTGKVIHKEGAVSTTLTYDNLINTSRGLNGIQFEIQNLANPGALSASDFEFRISPQSAFDEDSNPPTGWALAPAPSSVSVTGSGPHVALIQWTDNAIQNRWLRVTVKATENTGLAADEVYYVGHLLGETTGGSGGPFTVAFADITPIRGAVGSTVNASSTLDIDKSGTVAFADISAMRANVGAQLTVITVP